MEYFVRLTSHVLNSVVCELYSKIYNLFDKTQIVKYLCQMLLFSLYSCHKQQLCLFTKHFIDGSQFFFFGQKDQKITFKRNKIHGGAQIKVS